MTETVSMFMDAPRFWTLGVRVHAVQIPETIRTIERWIGERDAPRFVAVTGMHGVTEAQQDRDFKRILNAADLVVPDGMPLVWLGRRNGHDLPRRVYGPELMATFFENTGPSYKHFLYGGAPEVVTKLAEILRTRYGADIVGAHSPPFRELTREESVDTAAMINASGADIVWVGLSTPKQERWMHEHRHLLKTPALLGVGAAFDLIAGTKRTAPRWMQENGLEWLYRLMQEPKRLWRRYLVGGSKFLSYLALERAGIRRFDQ